MESNAVTLTAAADPLKDAPVPEDVKEIMAGGSREYNVPHLAFVGMKSYPQSLGDRKNRSGNGEEHKQALVENASRTLAAEIEKAQEAVKEFSGEDLIVAKPTERVLVIDGN